jgi:hypothetical protein
MTLGWRLLGWALFPVGALILVGQRLRPAPASGYWRQESKTR